MSNLHEIVKATAETTGLSQTKVREVYDALVANIQESVKGLDAGDTLRLPNLVNFKVVDVPEREHRNPRTGETVTKPAHKKVKAAVTATIRSVVA